MNERKIQERSKLLKIILENGFSTPTIEKIMTIIGNIEPSKKEETAKMLIPLVEQSKTEEEALQKVRELIA